MRAALMYYGYVGAGGKEKEKILKTAVSIELIHIFLLIHDDVIDRDQKRHGMDTIHHIYSKLGKKLFCNLDYRHFGNSMGIVIGDIVAGLGNQIIFDSKFDSDLIMKALSKLQSIISLTAIGEAQDIYMEFKGKAAEAEILKMYENKTARYTMEGPLHLGALLAGAEEGMLKSLSAFAIPTGIAFQIQDDILGVFGSEKKMGKSVGADVKEGKQTILVSEARKNYDKSQKIIFERIFGNPNLIEKDLKEFQKIIIDTGALEYARKLSFKLVEEGKRELRKVEINQEAKNFLAGIADYLIKREI